MARPRNKVVDILFMSPWSKGARASATSSGGPDLGISHKWREVKSEVTAGKQSGKPSLRSLLIPLFCPDKMKRPTNVLIEFLSIWKRRNEFPRRFAQKEQRLALIKSTLGILDEI